MRFTTFTLIFTIVPAAMAKSLAGRHHEAGEEGAEHAHDHLNATMSHDASATVSPLSSKSDPRVAYNLLVYPCFIIHFLAGRGNRIVIFSLRRYNHSVWYIRRHCRRSRGDDGVGRTEIRCTVLMQANAVD
jgi:hypothetical protein